MILTEEEIKKIEDEAAWWANDCGGCETCLRTFGTPPPKDFYEIACLVATIRALQEENRQLRALHGSLR